jgi:hypothetical protein
MGLRWKIALQQDKEKKDKSIMQQLETAHFFLNFLSNFIEQKNRKVVKNFTL